ncbi:MAG: 50S ribosomal protein L13 [Candidatus Diapherotrites archaeon]|nr:50S ribosomal protein L13 [Candidatus Diapherotrites archaeon]
MVVIDAKDLVLGRMCSVVAKRALKGEDIKIVNSEKCVIIGGRQTIFNKYKTRKDMKTKGNPIKGGPKYPKMPHLIVKRAIRGMLPYKKETGRKALKRIKVYIGIPNELKDSKFETIEEAKAPLNKSAVYIEEISKRLGARW